jgi:hypothetical protein
MAPAASGNPNTRTSERTGPIWRGAFLDADARAEIDLQDVCGVAGLWKRGCFQDRADADVDVQEIIEGDFGRCRSLGRMNDVHVSEIQCVWVVRTFARL